jgi:hypothetical protein
VVIPAPPFAKSSLPPDVTPETHNNFRTLKFGESYILNTFKDKSFL